jgi:hypothetical protein
LTFFDSGARSLCCVWAFAAMNDADGEILVADATNADVSVSARRGIDQLDVSAAQDASTVVRSSRPARLEESIR